MVFAYPTLYDVIVVGAGHAGCEGALAAARRGCRTLLLTSNLDTIGQMSCNPSIGGLAKAHLVREIDALGGEMARVIDPTTIQFRMLNTRKGPAVQAARAQADKKAYQFTLKHTVENQANLDVKQGLVTEVLVEHGRAAGVLTRENVTYGSRSVVLCPGTFLRGLIHMGETTFEAGRAGETPAVELSESLERLGFALGRLKTGTPARLNGRTIDYSRCTIQHGDPVPGRFSRTPVASRLPPRPCYITYTTPRTADIIRANLHRSPLYAGRIKGVGPRYCPSIEDKIVKFPQHERHQIYLEPEGVHTEEIYVNGASTSLPLDVQVEMIHSIVGLERAEMMRPGYAVEYDFAAPTQLKPSLETRAIRGLFFAGQINGTSGYEEAAAQGLIAGINAVQSVRGEEPLVLGRSEAYIGVLIDDLVTKGTEEPYRMFTSRAEYRLLLRQDNAEFRLLEYGHRFGLVSDEDYRLFERRRCAIAHTIEHLKTTATPEGSLDRLLARPGTSYASLRGAYPHLVPEVHDDVARQVEVEIKYAGYIAKQRQQVERLRTLEEARLPPRLDYRTVEGLRREAAERLSKVRPATLGQASRISGVTPSDITVLLVHLRKRAPHAARM